VSSEPDHGNSRLPADVAGSFFMQNPTMKVSTFTKNDDTLGSRQNVSIIALSGILY